MTKSFSLHSNLSSALGNEPVLLRLVNYVLHVRGARPFAALSDIDFFDIPLIVPHLFTMSVAGSPPRFLFKFSGTQADAILGLNPLRRYIDEVYPKPGNPIVKSYLDFARKLKPQILRASFAPPTGAPRLIMRLAIPLSDDGENLSHVLGALVIHYDHYSTRDIPSPSRPSVLDISYVDLP
jgi:hypothetical protein